MWQHLARWLKQRVSGAAAQGLETSGEDRRVWVRHPCDFATTLQPAHQAETQKLPARVRNISRGGISVEVGHAFQSGELLSVDLAGPEGLGSARVLAYVVHASQLAEGQWALGCIFAVELNDQDLRSFHATRVAAEQSDQRAWVRFDCELQAAYQLTRHASEAFRDARVVNVSPSGLALLVTEEIDVGLLLNVNCPGDSEHAPLRILATVVRATQLENQWVIGCTFIRELEEAELGAVLNSGRQPPR